MRKITLFFAISLLALSPFASADIPHLISLQGRLTDATNNPLTSTANFVFRIYASQTGGTPAWTETQNSIPLDTLGIFSVLLGSATALSIPFDSSYWLEVQVQSGTGPAQILSPRTRMGSAGYAIRSENPWNASGNDIYTTSAGNVGIGTASPGAKLDVNGGNIQTSGTVIASSFSGAGTGLTGTAGGLTSGSANSVPWSGVTSKPTTVAGYGITDMGSQSVNYANSAGNAPPQVHGDAAHSVAYEKTANKNIANGLAGLNANAKVINTQQDYAYGLTPTTSGFSPSPSPLTEVTNENEVDFATAGIACTSCTGYVTVDLGMLVTKTIVYRFKFSAVNNYGCNNNINGGIQISPDGSTWITIYSDSFCAGSRDAAGNVARQGFRYVRAYVTGGGVNDQGRLSQFSLAVI